MPKLNQLGFVRDEVRAIPGFSEKPRKLGSLKFFFVRMGRAMKLSFTEPEIILFAALQWVVIGLAYYLWVQMLAWIPEEVWRSAAESDSGSVADIVLLVWSFFIIGLAAFPLGILSACIGAVHFLKREGQPSTIISCLRMVMPRIGSLWAFNWVDGWITVSQILDRLPKKKNWPPSTTDEALYYAWKLGTIGVMPALITGRNLIDAGKESINLLRYKLAEAALLRVGYSLVCWVIGISAYVGAIVFFVYFDVLPSGETYSFIFLFYLWAGVPMLVAVGILLLFVRPVYLIALSDIYADYLHERGLPARVPTPTPRVFSILVIFMILASSIATAFLFRNGLGIMNLLAVPYKTEAEESPFAAEAYAVMISSQEAALRCLERNSDLRGRHSLWNNGVPQAGNAMCDGASTIWKPLPDGWKYTKVVDADVSDGTFTFGARSRSGELVGCGEKWCVSRNAKREVTILSLTPGPVSATMILPASRNVRPGEQVEIAQITVANSTDAPIDLIAFWYKKSGTASDAAIEMVYVEDGDGTYGTNYLHDLNSPRSKDGMVYINQPEMFLIGPKQSRTYTILIQLSAEARAETGKTVGLDFAGFSYDPQVSGMPALGTAHTIR